MAETEQKRNFFISYTKDDRTWAEWIAWQLEEAKYTTVIQAWDFRPGANFVLEMQKATANCERTIAVLSPDYLQSGFAQAELAAAFARDPTGEERTLVTVRVVECELEGLLPQIIYIDLVDLSEERAKEVLLAGVKRERAKRKAAPVFPKPAAPQGSAPRFPGALPGIWNVPHLRNPNFTGREDLLTQLRDKLGSGEHAAVTQAISGLGGVGKTQLAIEYAYRHTADYELVWWVHSEDPATLASDYARLATALGLPEKDAQRQEEAVEAVRRWLERHAGWLLVFDNVPGSEDVRDYLPRGSTGHVTITSRNPAWGGVASPLSVQVWEREESVDFLLRRTGQDVRDTAGKVADAVGGLPLALEQAAAYMDETKCSISHYLDLLKEHEPDLLARGSESQDYPHTVATTWGLSFEQAKEVCAAAADLLNLCAFLGPDDIPLDIIREGAEHLPERLAEAAGDDLAWDDAIAALRRYSLLELSGDGLTVHRLVQAVTQDRLSEEERREWAGAAVALVNGAFPGDVQTNVDAWPLCSRLVPHALAASAHAEELSVGQGAAGRLLNQSGTYLQGRAQFPEAKAAFERALQIAESFGLDDPRVAASLGNLGLVLQDLGDLAGAQAHFERALRLAEAAYGPDHPDVATLVNNLGSVLRAQGDLEGARAHYERALRMGETAYGPVHPKVAIRVNNLGGVLRAQGDLPRARAHFERALRIDELAYGRDHPEVATDVTNLGLLLEQEGDLAGARAAFQRALSIRRRVLADDHPATIRSRKSLEALGK